MFFIFGLGARNKTIARGTFFCPREGGDREYEHKMARRWFTLFFIPLIPLKELGDFVECQSCRATYYPNVLEGTTTGDIEDVTTTAIRHVVVAILRADGRVEGAERQAGQSVVENFASHPYSVADLDADLADLDRAHLTDTLQELGAILNAHGRENVLTSAVYLAAADGHVDPRELEVAREIGRALTMSSAHIEGTIQQELARIQAQ